MLIMSIYNHIESIKLRVVCYACDFLTHLPSQNNWGDDINLIIYLLLEQVISPFQ